MADNRWRSQFEVTTDKFTHLNALESFPLNNNEGKRSMQQQLSLNIESMRDLQNKLYADGTHSLLIIFQAMDAAGKDGTIKHVMSGVNPQGTRVYSFKVPSSEELSHDFLWRTYKCLPARGDIAIFNRSYYEEVLVVRVHPELLLKQRIPGLSLETQQLKNLWQQRYASINAMEHHLVQSGTTVLKFFLHVSKEEQKRRFLKRIDEPKRNWKFSMADARERSYWNSYMDAYSQMLRQTGTTAAPWYLIPADNKWFMRLAVSHIILEAMQAMSLSYPALTSDDQERLMAAKQLLLSEDEL